MGPARRHLDAREERHLVILAEHLDIAASRAFELRDEVASEVRPVSGESGPGDAHDLGVPHPDAVRILRHVGEEAA